MQQVKTKNGKFGENGAKPSFVSEGKEKERHLHWDNLAAIKGQTEKRETVQVCWLHCSAITSSTATAAAIIFHICLLADASIAYFRKRQEKERKIDARFACHFCSSVVVSISDVGFNVFCSTWLAVPNINLPNVIWAHRHPGVTITPPYASVLAPNGA